MVCRLSWVIHCPVNKALFELLTLNITHGPTIVPSLRASALKNSESRPAAWLLPHKTTADMQIMHRTHFHVFIRACSKPSCCFAAQPQQHRTGHLPILTTTRQKKGDFPAFTNAYIIKHCDEQEAACNKSTVTYDVLALLTYLDMQSSHSFVS